MGLDVGPQRLYDIPALLLGAIGGLAEVPVQLVEPEKLRLVGPIHCGSVRVPDYLKLVVVKANWPAFEPVFRRKADVERHFEAFSEFRNAVMQGRTLTEITRRAGELAMIWLETTISSEAAESGEAELEEESV
jgi:predicted RNase H-like HicB family nuclease